MPVLGFALLVGPGTSPLPAEAHGPCGCTSPQRGVPGDRLELVNLSAIEVVWNPPLDSLRIEPPGLIEGDYIEGAPSPVLFESPRRRRGVEVRIPDVVPGRYLMVVYDGSERGNHYTWDYVRVLDDAAGKRWLTVVLVGGIALLSFAGFAAWWRRKGPGET